MPSEIYRIDGPWPGRVAISARPRGGDWLEDEIGAWRASGFDIIVSLLTPEEVQQMDRQQEASYCRQNQMEFVSSPIVDRSVPQSRAAAVRLIERLDAELSRGKRINVHCRQGIGRSALIAASLLMARGLPPAGAIQKVSAARHTPVPETSEQWEWIDALASSLTPAQTKGSP
ncbi:MAG TPA: protein-tyrosine phosphatase family protein [Bryobacteraceae bacterium]|nr:protein-tyrosine phosphatase family protein [Bryobacteraceae bacterium]